MKPDTFRIFVFALICTMTACSSDVLPLTPTINPVRLIKKETQTTYSETNVSTTVKNYTYQNGVLLSMTSGTEMVDFTYVGNKVNKATWYGGGALLENIYFTYTGDLLTSTLSDTSNNPEKIQYFYNNGILEKMERGFTDDNGYHQFVIHDYVYQSGNIMNRTVHYPYFGAPDLYTEYTYDTANNPFKYMNPYLRLYFAKDNSNGISANNYTEIQQYLPDFQTHYTDETIYQNNYPIDIKTRTDDGTLLIHLQIEYY